MSRTWYHEPVLLQEVLERLPEDAQTILDGTLGHGGHTLAIVEKLRVESWKWKIVGVDKDGAMLQKAKERLVSFGDRIRYVHGSYAALGTIREEAWIIAFDVMLLDLGVNMEHFKDADRGFSIKQDGPLDMRFDATTGLPAQQWLATCTPQQFHEMLVHFTDFSPKRIAHMEQSFLSSSREFATTSELKQRAKSIGMNDKALAIFFQAIRITVNQELQELALFLECFPDFLTPGWRCIILTYHSGEDRMVKESFKHWDAQWVCTILTKHVITPKRTEKERNPAARSAKMRVIEKRSEDEAEDIRREKSSKEERGQGK